MKYVFNQLKKQKILVVVIVISTVLHSTFALANSLYSKLVFDNIANGTVEIKKILLMGLAITLWGAGSLLLKNMSVDILIGKIMLELRNSFMKSVVNSPVSEIRKKGEGRIINNYSQDISSVTGVIKSGMELITIPFEMIISTLFLYYFNWKLATVVIIVFPIILLSGRFIGNRIQEISKHYLSKDDSNVKLICRIIKGIEVIKVYRYQKTLIREFEISTQDQFKLDKKRAEYNGIYSGITDFFMGLPFVIVYVASAIMFSDQNITVGTLTLFLQLLNKITVPFVVYSRVLIQYRKAKASIIRLEEIITDDFQEEEMSVGFDGISVNDISFGYNENNIILKNCTFEFMPDTYYGIIGANGSGKSTISKLLMKLYEPNSGTVEFAKNIKKNNKIVYIEDKPAILFDDVLKNIIGNYKLEPEKLNKILSETELKTDLIDNIGEKTAEELSAGLLQRMVIARALYQVGEEDVLIIDEGFSALDADMRIRMYELIKKYQRQYRLLIFDITHNLNECERFDRILNVCDGQIFVKQ